MEPIIINLLENICGDNNCLTNKEIFSAILGGILTGFSAIIIYVFQKRMENKSNKHSTATILHGEVKRILAISNMNEDIQIMTHTPKRLPTNQIYQGLLHSGNIKYFEGDLQDKLDEMYTNFEMDSLKPSDELYLEILQDLEKIIEKNRSYRIITHISKLNPIKYKN